MSLNIEKDDAASMAPIDSIIDAAVAAEGAEVACNMILLGSRTCEYGGGCGSSRERDSDARDRGKSALSTSKRPRRGIAVTSAPILSVEDLASQAQESAEIEAKGIFHSRLQSLAIALVRWFRCANPGIYFGTGSSQVSSSTAWAKSRCPTCGCHSQPSS